MDLFLRFLPIKKPSQHIASGNAYHRKIERYGYVLPGRAMDAQHRQDNEDREQRNAKAHGGVCAGFKEGLFFGLAHSIISVILPLIITHRHFIIP